MLTLEPVATLRHTKQAGKVLSKLLGLDKIRYHVK